MRLKAEIGDGVLGRGSKLPPLQLGVWGGEEFTSMKGHSLVQNCPMLSTFKVIHWLT